MFRAAIAAQPPQVRVLRFALGQIERRAAADAGRNRLIDQRVERRHADRAEHRGALGRRLDRCVGTGRNRDVVGIVCDVSSQATSSARCTAPRRADRRCRAARPSATIIHDSCGLAFTASGFSPSARFTSVTSPLTGAVQLGHRLDRLDRAEDVALLQLPSDLRQLEVDDVAELLLRVVGDADARVAAGDRSPTRGLSCISDRRDTYCVSRTCAPRS